MIGATKLPNGQEVPVVVNEDPGEILEALQDPVIYTRSDDFDQDELKMAMTKEFRSLADFDVYEPINIQSLSEAELSNVMTLRWDLSSRDCVSEVVTRSLPTCTRPMHQLQ